jgi:hypothetical protein
MSSVELTKAVPAELVTGKDLTTYLYGPAEQALDLE